MTEKIVYYRDLPKEVELSEKIKSQDSKKITLNPTTSDIAMNIYPMYVNNKGKYSHAQININENFNIENTRKNYKEPKYTKFIVEQEEEIVENVIKIQEPDEDNTRNECAKINLLKSLVLSINKSEQIIPNGDNENEQIEFSSVKDTMKNMFNIEY